MAITFIGTSTVVTGTTSATPIWPASYTPTAGHIAVLIATSGHATATNIPATTGWGTEVTTLSGGGGTFGVDAGPRRVTIWTRTLVGGDTLAAVTQPSGGSTMTLGVSVTVFSNATGSWGASAGASGSDSTSGTGFSAVTVGSISWAPGDAVCSGYALASDTPTASAETMSATGVTFATVTERRSTGVTTGNDHRHVVASTVTTAGTTTAGATLGATLSVASTGVAGYVRLREVAGATLGDAALTVTSTRTADGEWERGTGASLTASGGRTAAGALTLSSTASVAGSAATSSSAAITRPSSATRTAAASITAVGDVLPGGAVQNGQASLTATATVTATGRDVSAWSGVVSATTFAAAVEGQAALTATGAITAAPVVVRPSSTSTTGTAAVTSAGLVARAGASAVTATATIAATAAVVRAGQASLTVTASRSAFGRTTVTAQAALTVTSTRTSDGSLGVIPISGQAALTATATIRTKVRVFVPEPQGGTSNRPNDGTTDRPNGGTTSPPNGRTSRPYAGVTYQP